jgi:hypothetical protein
MSEHDMIVIKYFVYMIFLVVFNEVFTFSKCSFYLDGHALLRSAHNDDK